MIMMHAYIANYNTIAIHVYIATYTAIYRIKLKWKMNALINIMKNCYMYQIRIWSIITSNI